MNEIPKETMEWLKENNAKSWYSYFLPLGQMHYSEGYLKSTPLEVIKERYEKHLVDLGLKEKE